MLEKVINFLAYGSLLFAGVAAYLQLNKLWTRKHLPDVAESISIPGIVVESVPLFFFGVYFLFKGELLGIIDSFIWLVSAAIMTMIGAGVWVQGQRKRGFWGLLRGAVSRESRELTSLARALLAPASAPQLVRVLTLMAAVDGKVDEPERTLVSEFAAQWRVAIDWEAALASESSGERLVLARRAFAEYLETSPPEDQVMHLLDVLSLLIDADGDESEEERVVYAEMSGQAQAYLSDDRGRAGYSVILVPQGDQQDEAIRTLLAGAHPRTYAGGKAYVAGVFFSKEYAEIIRDEYRALGFFTVVMHEAAALAS